MFDTTKIVQVGNSLGVILSKELLAKLRAEKGDAVYITETTHGLEISAIDPNFEADMRVGADIAKRYRNTLHNLAK